MLGWIETEIPALRGRLDAERIGVAGHSFGAGTAQLIAGARLRGRAGGQQFRDRRVRAALLLSPQGTGQLHGSHSWSAIRIPMMTITGTHDFGRGGGPSWRTEPFHGAPAGNKYLIVIERGVHDLGGIGRSATSFPYAHDARQAGITQRLSLAFWDAHLKGDTQALRFLKGSALEELLGADARVQRK
jgi:pimeloyl-ACP methyl ester carboxylesterase